MLKNYEGDLIKKTVTPEFAASLVKDGDLITYTDHALLPVCFDKAFGEIALDRKNVALKTGNCTMIPAAVQKDPSREHVAWIDGHFNGLERKAFNDKLVNYYISTYNHIPYCVERYNDFDICVIEATPMDKHGFFNYGLSNSITPAIIKKSKIVIVETNKNVPTCYGGYSEAIHIDDVDYVIEGENRQLVALKSTVADEASIKIANLILPEIESGSCLQLGIGAMPNTIGELLLETDVKDLGVQTEMCTDAVYKLYEAGKITGKNKAVDKGKIVYAFAMGSQDLYDFLDCNPSCASCPVDYVNAVEVMCKNEKMISINNAVELDIFGQISAESKGPKHISGTGGQLDFVWGSFISNGGKSIIALTSTVTRKDGTVVSRVVPTFDPGTVVTTPRSLVNYVATEYGLVQLKGLSTWQRAEKIISIAHPDFRDGLIKAAEENHIWTYTNKKI